MYYARPHWEVDTLLQIFIPFAALGALTIVVIIVIVRSAIRESDLRERRKRGNGQGK